MYLTFFVCEHIMELNTIIDIKPEPSEMMFVNVLENRKIPLLLDGTFFVIEQALAEKTKVKIEARCTKCNKILSGLLESTTNFLNHLKVSFKHSTRSITSQSHKITFACMY